MPPPMARGMGAMGCALQYHASYPRDKRLVQAPSCRAPHEGGYAKIPIFRLLAVVVVRGVLCVAMTASFLAL